MNTQGQGDALWWDLDEAIAARNSEKKMAPGAAPTRKLVFPVTPTKSDITPNAAMHVPRPRTAVSSNTPEPPRCHDPDGIIHSLDAVIDNANVILSPPSITVTDGVDGGTDRRESDGLIRFDGDYDEAVDDDGDDCDGPRFAYRPKSPLPPHVASAPLSRYGLLLLVLLLAIKKKKYEISMNSHFIASLTVLCAYPSPGISRLILRMLRAAAPDDTEPGDSSWPVGLSYSSSITNIIG